MSNSWKQPFAVGMCLACCLLGASAFAQDPATAKAIVQAKELSLDDCIATALKNHADVLVSEQSVLGAKARYVQAKSSYFPTISIQNTPISLNGTVLGGGQSSTGSTTGTSLTVTQNIYDGGQREASVKEAQAAVKQSEAGLLRDQQTLTFNVIKAYYEALRAKHLAEVSEASVKYLQGQQELIHTRVEVGDAAPVDSLPVEAQLANAKVDQLSAKNTIRTKIIDLQNSIGLAPQPDFSIQEIGDTAKDELQTLDKYQEFAMVNRPDIAGTDAQVIAAKAAVKSAKINTMPHLAVTGQYDTRVDKVLQNWNINGGIVYDLFDGQKNHAVYKASQASLKSSQIQAAQLSKDIAAQVQQAYLNLESANERLDATTLSLEASQKNYQAQEARYKEGLAVTLDLLNAQLSVTTAQSNTVQARYDYLIAKAQLDYAIGKQGGLNAK